MIRGAYPREVIKRESEDGGIPEMRGRGEHVLSLFTQSVCVWAWVYVRGRVCVCVCEGWMYYNKIPCHV